MKKIITRTEKRCSKCKVVKPIEEFYNNKRSKSDGKCADCKECSKNKSKKRYLNEYFEKDHRTLPNPNEYINKFEKELVFDILKALGWIFNEKNGIWYKPGGWKDKDGNWKFPKRNKRCDEKEIEEKKKIEYITPRKIGNREKLKQQISKIDKTKPRTSTKVKNSFSDEIEDEIRLKYSSDKKETMLSLAKKYNCSYTRINHIINYTNNVK